jgi:aryl-alcohol dehydrogenase-like predicted oxidoreductase
MFPEVTATIPGARSVDQVKQNVAAAELPPLSDAAMAKVREVYDRLIRAQVHERW